MRNIEWSKVPAGTLVYAWDEEVRPARPWVGYFEKYLPKEKYCILMSDGSFDKAEFVFPEDYEKYKKKES